MPARTQKEDQAQELRLRVALLSEFHRLSPRVENEVGLLADEGHSFRVFHWLRTDPKAVETVSSVSQKVEHHYILLRAPFGSYSLVFFIPLLYLKLWRALRGQEYDVVHFTHLLFLPFAVFWARTHGAKSVYDAYEFHTADFAKRRRYRLLGLPKLLEMAENRLVSCVDGVLTLDSVGRRLENRYRRHNSNVAVLYNVPRLDAEPAEESSDGPEISWVSGRTLAYVGGLSRIKGADKALQALSLVRREIPRVRLVMIGSFLDDSEIECREYVRQRGIEDDVLFIPWLPYPDMMRLLRRSTIGLACYQPIDKFWLASRGTGRKFLTYMQASLPIVGPEFGEIGQVVRDEDCGILCDTRDPQKIAEALVYLLKNPDEAEAMGKRGRAAIEQKYNMDIEQRKLLEVYHRLGVRPREQAE